MDISELKFTCPRCGKHRIEVVERVTTRTPIFVDTDEWVDRDTDNTEPDGDELLIGYRCVDCHEPLPVNSDSELVEYLKQQQPEPEPVEIPPLEPNMLVQMFPKPGNGRQPIEFWLITRVYGENNDHFAGYRLGLQGHRYLGTVVCIAVSEQAGSTDDVVRIFKRVNDDGVCVPIQPSKIEEILKADGLAETYRFWEHPYECRPDTEGDDHAED